MSQSEETNRRLVKMDEAMRAVSKASEASQLADLALQNVAKRYTGQTYLTESQRQEWSEAGWMSQREERKLDITKWMRDAWGHSVSKIKSGDWTGRDPVCVLLLRPGEVLLLLLISDRVRLPTQATDAH